MVFSFCVDDKEIKLLPVAVYVVSNNRIRLVSKSREHHPLCSD